MKKRKNNKTASKDFKEIALPINPKKLRRILGGGYIWSILYTCFCGIVICYIYSSQQEKIKKWLKGLANKKCDMSVFRKCMQIIHRCGVFAIVVSLLTAIALGAVIAGTYGKTIAVAIGIIGPLAGLKLVFDATSIINGLDKKEKYIYKTDGNEIKIKNKTKK